jgi:hypothetical protein
VPVLAESVITNVVLELIKVEESMFFKPLMAKRHVRYVNYGYAEVVRTFIK